MQEDMQTLTFSGKHKLIYGTQITQLSLVFLAESSKIQGYSGLIEISGICEQDMYSNLKKQIDILHKAFRKTDDFSIVNRWESENMTQEKDFTQLEEQLIKLLGSNPVMDSLRFGLQGAPLVSIVFHEDGAQAGLFTVNAKTQVLINALRMNCLQ